MRLPMLRQRIVVIGHGAFFAALLGRQPSIRNRFGGWTGGKNDKLLGKKGGKSKHTEIIQSIIFSSIWMDGFFIPRIDFE